MTSICESLLKDLKSGTDYASVATASTGGFSFLIGYKFERPGQSSRKWYIRFQISSWPDFNYTDVKTFYKISKLIGY